jgi:hypothetical protein
MRQIDIFGNEQEIQEPVKKGNRYRTMQEKHGYTEGETCRTCGHLLKFASGNRNFYKCEMWEITHSTATDIKLKDKACGKWVPGI